jgi:hypothetical protein
MSVDNKTYTGGNQTQWGADSHAVAEMSGGKSAGGMRGLGLIAFILGQVYLNNKSLDLSKDYYNTNAQDFHFFQNTHQAPMAATAAEAFSPTGNPTYTQDLYVFVPAAAARVAEMDRQWLIGRKSLSRYATGAGSRLDYEYAKHRVQQMAANWYMGYRSELTYAQDHNERAFNRQVMVVNIGIGAGNEVARGLASAASGLNSAYTQLGNQFGSIASGLSGSIGQKQGQADVQSTYRQITGS